MEVKTNETKRQRKQKKRKDNLKVDKNRNTHRSEHDMIEISLEANTSDQKTR